MNNIIFNIKNANPNVPSLPLVSSNNVHNPLNAPGVANVNQEYGYEALEALTIDQTVTLLRIRDNDTGMTVLHRAVRDHNEGVVELLLKRLDEGQMVDILKIPDNDGVTALHYAVKENDEEIVPLLLERLNENQKIELLKIKDNDGRTVLCSAVKKDKNEAIELLLTGLSVEQKIELLRIQDDKDKRTALHWTVEHNNRGAIELLLAGLSRIQKIELLNIQDVIGWTAFSRALMLNNIDAIGLYWND